MRRARGYTLLEVVLAFSVLALGLGLLIGTLSGGLRQVRAAGDASEATLYAQSLLDSLGQTAPLEPGGDSGEFADGRYRWQLEIAEFADPAAEGVSAQPLAKLYRVELAVEWGAGGPGQQARFVTLRAVAPQELSLSPAGTRSQEREQ